MRVVAVLVSAAAGLMAVAPGAPAAKRHHSAVRRCGTIRPTNANGADVQVIRGKISCPSARKVMLDYIQSGRSPRGWSCRHDKPPSAGRCSGRRGTITATRPRNLTG